jgi:hypothetical protein
MEMELLYLLGFLALVVAARIAWLAWRANGLLRHWAQDNGYEIVSAQYRWFLRGPFWWALGSNYAVYRVTVSKGKGKQRWGWLCFGGWFWGLASGTVDVRWDD